MLWRCCCVCKLPHRQTTSRGLSAGSSVACLTPMLVSARHTWESRAPKSSSRLPLQPSVSCMDWGLSLPPPLEASSGVHCCQQQHPTLLYVIFPHVALHAYRHTYVHNITCYVRHQSPLFLTVPQLKGCFRLPENGCHVTLQPVMF